MICVDLEKIKATQTVDVICDYCGVGFQRKKHHIVTLRKITPKDSCGSKECTIAKRAESTKQVHGEGCFKGKILEKARASNLAKYGVDNAAKLDFVKDKIKKTNIKRYGRSSYLGTEKCRNQCRQKAIDLYGVDHFSKAEPIKDKAKKTIIKKYGDLFQRTDEWKEKVKKTCLKKYGVMSVCMVDEFKLKKEETMMRKYGGKGPLSDPKIRERANISLKKKYGVNSALQSPVIVAKMKKTCMERYGNEHAMTNEGIKTKSMQARIDKYGSLISNLGKTQREITDWLNSFGFDFKSDVVILEGKELDLYDPAQKLALEYCGLYWHNENSPQPRTRSYHHDKWKRCKEKGIQLLTIFDDEWKGKTEVLKSVILSKLGIFSNRIQARKCKVREVTKEEMVGFCEMYHLQGGNKLSEVCFGLFNEGELVGVADLGRHHRKKDKDSVVLTRLCFKSGTQVVGGSGKLFKACVEWCRANSVKNIISWSDNRYSDGKTYESLGFKKAGELPPDYYYVDMFNPKHRISKQSQSKKKANCPSDMTELQWANSRGLSRIWDCGKVRWEFRI